MLHRKLNLNTTIAACAVGATALFAGGCDGNVDGWMLPNFPGDASQDAPNVEHQEAGSGSSSDASGGTSTAGAGTSVVTALPDAGSVIDAGVTTCSGECELDAATSTASSVAENSSAVADAAVPTGDGGQAVCGDGVVEGTESCDDGNANNEDGCDNTCIGFTCGDSIVEGAEQCDPPTTSGGCGSKCQFLPPRCGDGVLQVEDGEGCDDGNSEPSDGCFECGSACGNGEIDPGEVCEPGFASLLCVKSWNTCIPCSVGTADCESRDVCDPTTCKGRSACGNGTVDVGESCDPPGSNRCDDNCQLLPKECGNGHVEFGEDCDPPDGTHCNDSCRHIGCGNQAVEGQEECDPPNGLTCDESCRIKAPCVPGEPPASLLPVDGSFAANIDGWTAGDNRVQLTHDLAEGVLALGAMSIELDNGASGGAPLEIRGATLCLPVAQNTAYTFSGSYKFPAGVTTDSGTSVSLYLYPNLSCTGAPVEASKVRGRRGQVSAEWQSYQTSTNTAVAAGLGDFLSMMVRVDVWRPAEVTAVSVLWDDVALTNAAVQSDGYCGDCRITGTETCDDGNALGGDGCNGQCVAEGCLNGLVDDGEQCDDGNLTFNDGCDPDCTTGNACRECAAAQCSEPATACYQDATPVTEGIGKGQSSNQLCSGLVDCITRTGCALDTAASSLPGLLSNTKSVQNCYCGTARGEDCLEGEADGSCKLEIEAAVETSDPVLVLQRIGLVSDNYPAYRSAADLWTCVSDITKPCVSSCVAEPTCGNGKLGERGALFLTTLPRTFDGTTESSLTCGELGHVSCFHEECDDGNTLDGDGCDASCYREACGNGVLQEAIGEECDDGNTESNDGCSITCEFEWVCGDSQLDPNEDCDDGNDVIGDGCDENCLNEECGNSVVQINEQCDPPNGSQCLPGCVFAPLDPCTECLLEMGDEPASPYQQCPGSFLLDGNPSMSGTFKCLADPLCEAAWNCFAASRCGQEIGEDGSDTGLNACYCGPGQENLAECQSNPDFVPQGECADEMMAAYEAQFGARDDPPLFLQYMLDFSGEAPSLGAATYTYFICTTVGQQPALDVDMCNAGFSSERRLECSQACFSDLALTEEQLVGEDCLPQSVAPAE